MTSADLPVVTGSALLRPPEHRVSPRAVGYWRLSVAFGHLFLVVPALIAIAVVPERPWWAWTLLVLLLVLVTAHIALMPPIRYRVHRWEVTPTAVHTLEGWIGRETRIAPISRIQTVDSRQGALMRLFDLASLTVTTASAAGPITISCLDKDLARQLVAQLTEVTAATEGDAT